MCKSLALIWITVASNFSIETFATFNPRSQALTDIHAPVSGTVYGCDKWEPGGRQSRSPMLHYRAGRMSCQMSMNIFSAHEVSGNYLFGYQVNVGPISMLKSVFLRREHLGVAGAENLFECGDTL
jgi:hypothetical protein